MKTISQTKGLLTALVVAARAFAIGDASPALAWDPPTYLSAPGVSTSSGHRLVIDGKGRAVALWLLSDGSDLRVQAAIRPAGGVFASASSLSAAGADVGGYDICATKKGAVTVVWDRGDGFVTRWLEVADLGPKSTTFGAPTTFSPPGEVSDSPHLGCDKKGNATAIWLHYPSNEVKSATRAVGSPFGTAETLSSADAYTPVLAVGPKGNAVAAWSQNPDPNVIEAAIRPARGTFAPSVALTDPVSDTDVLAIAMDAKGNVSLAARNATMGEIPVGATTSAAWFSIPFDHQYGAVIKYDKAGNQYALWTASTATTYQVRLAVRPVGATSFGPVTQVSDPAVFAIADDLLVDKKGNVRAIWQEWDGTNTRIKTARRPAGGVFDAAVTLSAAGVDAAAGRLVTDKKGNLIATWMEDDGSGQYRIATSYQPR